MSQQIILKSGREKSVLAGHPWIYSGAIKNTRCDPEPGITVEVLSTDGETLGLAAYSPLSAIRARLWGLGIKSVGADLIKQRIIRASEMRQQLIPQSQTNALRLVYGESDGLPGLIVDQYGEYLSLQILSAGPEYWRETIISILSDIIKPQSIIERSDVDVRGLEGMKPRKGVVYGKPITKLFTLFENNMKFYVDLLEGQKTGFYLDQRENRLNISNYAYGKEMLNCFCYTGGFSIYGLAKGAAHITSIDSSENAVSLAKKNMSLNILPDENTCWIVGDVFFELRKLRDQGRSFDLIILDPPKFAPTISQVEKASRGYKDINLLAFKLLRPNGLLATFSCSGGISPDLFQKIVAGAALDAKADVQILEVYSQGKDHPVALNFPESAYLKGFLCRKI